MWRYFYWTSRELCADGHVYRPKVSSSSSSKSAVQGKELGQQYYEIPKIRHSISLGLNKIGYENTIYIPLTEF